jgi:diguanylate cyclase (GGDEF)-like protein
LPKPRRPGAELSTFLLRIDRLYAFSRLQLAETQIKSLERRVEELNLQDLVTGLPNRRHFSDRLAKALPLSHRHGHIVSVLFVDLDRFKRVNDLHGHAGGDEVLRQVAARLQEGLRQGDTLACLGGDRFMILLQEIKDVTTAARVAQKLLESVQNPFRLGPTELSLTASIGVCVHPQDGLDGPTLEAHAESAMCRAKERGGDRIECFTTTLNEVSLERQELETSLRDALKNKELEIHYQPQFLPDGQLAGAEALLRWNHPTLGQVPPAKFIPLAEETRLILPIGEWVLREACHRMAKWQTLSRIPLVIAVNVSAVQFTSGDWAARVVMALAESGLEPTCLELELTESMVMGQGYEDLVTLRRLREMGTKIAIDDFGTGYSSLGYLQRLPITTLKIDKTFITSLMPSDGTDSSESIVQAVIQLAHGLNFTVVAEGVETEEQRDKLEQLGCDCLQGYLLGQPMPAHEFEALLKSLSTADAKLEFMSNAQFLNSINLPPVKR